MIRLLGRSTSGNVQKVLFVLEEIGVKYTREDYGRQFNNTQTPEYKKLNPNAKVPTLIDGETVRQEITLRRAAGREFEQVELVLKLGIEDTVLEVPVVVRPLARVARGAGDPGPADRIGELVPPDGQRVTAKGTLAARYDQAGLRLTVVIEDERLVPLRVSPGGVATGDQLLIGVAGPQGGNGVEVRFDPSVAAPTAEALAGTPSTVLEGWSCAGEIAGSGPRTYRVRIPAAAFGVAALRGGERLRIAVHYVDDDADGFPAARLRWGRGIDGTRGSSEYRVTELVGD